MKREPYARRTWKRSPAAPVQVSCTPVVVDVELMVKPAVGGPREPAAPTSNVSSFCAVRPEASVAMTRKSYLPEAKPAVLSEVAHVTRPATARPGPPGVVGEAGLIGSMLRMEVHTPLPNGAYANSSEARPLSEDTWTARSTIAWSGRSAAFGVRMLRSGAVRFQATGVVTHWIWLLSLSFP